MFLIILYNFQAGLVEQYTLSLLLYFHVNHFDIYQIYTRALFEMPSFKSMISVVVLGLGLVSAAPGMPKMSPQMRRAYDFGVKARENMELSRRQNPTTGLPDALTDVDILELYVSLFPFFPFAIPSLPSLLILCSFS